MSNVNPRLVASLDSERAVLHAAKVVVRRLENLVRNSGRTAQRKAIMLGTTRPVILPATAESDIVELATAAYKAGLRQGAAQAKSESAEKGQ